MRRLVVVVGLLLWMPVLHASDCFRTSVGLAPVAITRSAAHESDGLTAASRITPRALNGTPTSNGKVVFLGLGMSNTSRVWTGFRAVMNGTGTAPSTLKWVNGTRGGDGAPQWADPTCACWTALEALLVKQKVSAAQVQAVFLMVTTPFPWQTPEQNAIRFAADVTTILGRLEARFANLQIVYLAGNYYGGYDTGQNKTPEPHDYYENMSLQGVQDAYTGRLWVSASSTMLWADGVNPRPWDGLTLFCSDVKSEGVHLSDTGQVKYGQWLYDALMSDPTTLGWMR